MSTTSKPGELQQLTRVNDDVLSQRRLGGVEEIWYASHDKTRVQGWIVKPPDFNPKPSGSSTIRP